MTLPIETVCGLPTNVFNPDAVAKIFTAKERSNFDLLIVHIATLRGSGAGGGGAEEIQETVNHLANEFWPEPLTILLPKTPEVQFQTHLRLRTSARLAMCR